MPQISLILSEGTVTLDPDLTYQVYGESLSAKSLSKLDFSHLPWLDQITLLQDIEVKQEVIMLYHPIIVASIFKDQETSEYWGKNHFECLTLFKRNALKEKVDRHLERKLSKPVELNNPHIRMTKTRAIDGLEKLGYDRATAKLNMAEFLAEKGNGYLNLKPSELVKHVDEFTLN
jgi:hypothetical protein